jgi:hypothetical protein
MLHMINVAVTTVTTQVTVLQDVVPCSSVEMCCFLLHSRIRKHEKDEVSYSVQAYRQL